MRTYMVDLLRTMAKRHKRSAGVQEPVRKAGFFPPSGMIDLVLRKTCLRAERPR